ncbi:acetyl-CoA carboxylase biotin carboxyl carrier protein [Novosphingobium sp.]|uniref:acetyl-CoA carboxylase biotin carboxyl carrier protein n=1 Tax=Novosphingobium sp. TaxID=1874826 RepID=UPI0038B7D90B
MTNPQQDEDLEALVRQFQASDLTEMHLRTADIELFLSRNPDADFAMGRVSMAAPPVAAAPAAPKASTSAAPPGPATAATPAPAASTAVADGHVVVTAPYLGTFYRAPKPGEPNFVELDQTVEAGTDLCLVEVMKLFTAVSAPSKGVIRQILARDGEMVAEGAPLFALEPVG